MSAVLAYKCPECEYRSRTEKGVNIHLTKRHPAPKPVASALVCHKCERSFTNVQSYRHHVSQNSCNDADSHVPLPLDWIDVVKIVCLFAEGKTVAEVPGAYWSARDRSQWARRETLSTFSTPRW